jgi:hypothetical protein
MRNARGEKMALPISRFETPVNGSGKSTVRQDGKRESKRNPFPGEHFFMVPLALYDSGLSRWMKPSQLIRYITLLRVANYHSSTEVQIGLRYLSEMDGVSLRAARDAHIKLQEYGLIRIAKTNPFTYTLISPAYWEKNFGNIKPRFKRAASLKVQSEWVPVL